MRWPRRRSPASRSTLKELQWLLDVIWGSSGSVSLGDSGDVKPGDEAYVVLPRISRPRFLVPLSSPPASVASLRLYNRMRSRVARTARSAFAAGFRIGVTQRLFRDRVIVHSSSHAESLVEHLRQAMGRSDLVVGVGLRKRGLYTKPVLQLFSSEGDPIGYAKIGWSAATQAAVRNEMSVIDGVHRSQPTSFQIPAVLYRGTWRGLEIGVVEPLPVTVRRHRPAERLPSIEIIRDIALWQGSHRARLDQSGYWEWLEGRLGRAAEEAEGRGGKTLRDFFDQIHAAFGTDEIEFASWHGDLSPWNIAWSDGTLFVVDWEHARGGVPMGFDVLQYHFQVSFVRDRRDVATAAEVAKELSAPALKELGVPPKLVPAIGLLHLAETFLRAHDAARLGGPSSPRLYQPLLETIAKRTERVEVRP